MSRHLLLILLVLLVSPGLATAKPDVLAMCPGGRFVASEPLVLGDRAPEARAVVLADGQVALGGSCAATAAGMTRSRHGTLVRASWQTWEGVAGPVRLRATMRGTCGTLAGVVRARHRHRRFVATREAVCGNGVREGLEECDATVCCTGDCRRSDDPGCPSPAA